MEEAGRTRRAVLAGAGAAGVAVALAGCAAYGEAGGSAPPANTGSAATEGGGGVDGALATVDQIPVGGGKVLEDQNVVVTQPTQGTFKCFSAICTHAGCTVGGVSGGTINCPCHGSKFKIADGSVANGPANKPLPPVNITVDGNNNIKRA
jgi:Rieske Fe-S protein